MGFLQGWMEKTRAYLLIEIFSINDETLLSDSNHIAVLTDRVNDLMNQEIKEDIEESAEIGVFRNIAESDEIGVFRNNGDVLGYAINITPDENIKFINIFISATLNEMPIRAYTQITTYGNWKTYK